MHQGEFLKKLILKKYNVKQFAEKVGKTRTYLQTVFNNEEVSPKLLKTLAPYLGVKYIDLVEMKDDLLEVSEPIMEYGKKVETKANDINHELENLRDRLKDKDKTIATLEALVEVLTHGSGKSKKQSELMVVWRNTGAAMITNLSKTHNRYKS